MNLDKEEEKSIRLIKASYPEQTRIDLINSLLELEKEDNSEKEVENIHMMLDQIFSVILKNLSWNIATSANDWDYRPINLMINVFRNIEKTKWYDIRHKQVIDQLTKNTAKK